MEKWADILGFEGFYQISSKGRVKSLRNNLILRPGISNKYAFVALWKNGKQYGRKVHSLVASSFLDRPISSECVNHKDGNRLNNDVTNLEWTTFKENSRHAIRSGLVATKPQIHGTISSYSNKKCRCEKCRNAWAEYHRHKRQLVVR